MTCPRVTGFLAQCDKLEDATTPEEKAGKFNEVQAQFDRLDKFSPEYLRANRRFIRLIEKFSPPCSGGSGYFHCFSCSSSSNCAKSVN